jgi:LysM repeat protein
MLSRIVCPIVVAAALAVPSAASAYFSHTVVPGESLYSIAAADGLSVAQLAATNGISPYSQIQTGSTVMIPPQGSSSISSTTSSATGSTTVGDGDGDSDDVAATSSNASTTSSASTTSTSTGGGYVVQPGDTLSAIATRAGMTVAELASSNGLDPNGLLVSGSVLRVPAGGPTYVSASHTASAEGQPVGAVAQGNPTSPPYPTPERVSASQVGSIASANGVPASLAQAVGWQESGFNNDLVSSADARGVMQILPGTWDWIQRSLTAGTPLASASAASNVRGGVLLLHSLLSSTGGNPALAAAGYYQGLSSVRAHGLYSDTQQYVNSVMALARRFGGG